VNNPIPDLLQGNTRLHILDLLFSPPQPILLCMEDTIPDSFPYLLLITEGCMHLLILSLCTCTAPGAQCGWCKLCKGADMLTGIRDAQVIFVNLDKDRMLDMMVQ